MKKSILQIIFLFIFCNTIVSQENKINIQDCDSSLRNKIVSGVSYALVERIPEKLFVPENPNCETGQFVFSITVSKDGDVTRTKFIAKKSTTISSELMEELTKTCQKNKFSFRQNSPKFQEGTITYVFKFDDQ